MKTPDDVVLRLSPEEAAALACFIRAHAHTEDLDHVVTAVYLTREAARVSILQRREQARLVDLELAEDQYVREQAV